MKKILIQTLFLSIGLCLSAQNLYVQPIGSEQMAFSLADKPKITFGNGTLNVNQTSFQLNHVQNISFVKHTNSTNIATISSDNQIHVYPNPVKDELFITVGAMHISTSLNNHASPLQYRIFEVNGKLQKTDHIHSVATKINLQNFRAGVYILNLYQNGQYIQSFKIIKQ